MRTAINPGTGRPSPAGREFSRVVWHRDGAASPFSRRSLPCPRGEGRHCGAEPPTHRADVDGQDRTQHHGSRPSGRGGGRLGRGRRRGRHQSGSHPLKMRRRPRVSRQRPSTASVMFNASPTTTRRRTTLAKSASPRSPLADEAPAISRPDQLEGDSQGQLGQDEAMKSASRSASSNLAARSRQLLSHASTSRITTATTRRRTSARSPPAARPSVAKRLIGNGISPAGKPHRSSYRHASPRTTRRSAAVVGGARRGAGRAHLQHVQPGSRRARSSSIWRQSAA